MSELTITIPKIDGISPTELKKDIDYLILQKKKEVYPSWTTRVVVLDQMPSKEYTSRKYEVVSENVTKSPDMTPTKILRGVCVEYPEQTVVQVMLHGKNIPKDADDIISSVSKEIKQYLSVFRVEVTGPGLADDSDEQLDSGQGLELSVSISKDSEVLLQRLKKDIGHIIMKANSHSHAPCEDTEQPHTAAIIKHRITVCDCPSEPRSCTLKVALLGDVEEVYYKTLWEIHRKIRRMSRNIEVDHSLSNSDDDDDDDELLKEVWIHLPNDDNLYEYTKKNYGDLKSALTKSLKSQHIIKFDLKLRESEGTTFPLQVCARVITGVCTNNSAVIPLCANIKSELMSWLHMLIGDKKIDVTCVTQFQPEHRQEVAEGYIHYAMNWHPDKVMMYISYPEQLTDTLKDMKTCSEIFQEGVLRILSKCDFTILRTQLENPSSVYSQMCPCDSSEDGGRFRTPHLEGYRTTHAIVDSGKNKDDIARSILLELSEKING